MPKKLEMPNLDNATDEFILDEMGKLSMIENYAKKMRAFYKEVYYSRKGIKNDDDFPIEGVVHTGETFIATTTQSFPNRLDQTALKESKPEIFEEFTKTGQQLTTRFTLAQGVVNPIVNDLIEQLKAELDLD